MNCTIFYSWQSDLPNKDNRTLIQKCIEKAISDLNRDEKSGTEYSYDESTRDEAGAPDIGNTIIQKIEKSDIFICDISIINNNSKFRKTPNPNVLFELGYAANALGWDKIICVFNICSGRIELLPFDINHKRILTYSSNDINCKDKMASCIKSAIFAMKSKGLLYNPLRDRIKGMIDYCYLEALKQVCCLLYGTVTMSTALAQVYDLLSLSEDEIRNKLIDGHQILGFFAHNNLQNVRDKLDTIFAEITTSSLYPTEWALNVLNLIDWLRSYQWRISGRSKTPLATNAKQSSGVFEVAIGKTININNPDDSCLLLKKVGKGKGEVLFSATMTEHDRYVLLTFQNIIPDHAQEYGKCFYWLIQLANTWRSSTGNEFILDPDYYYIK